MEKRQRREKRRWSNDYKTSRTKDNEGKTLGKENRNSVIVIGKNGDNIKVITVLLPIMSVTVMRNNGDDVKLINVFVTPINGRPMSLRKC